MDSFSQAMPQFLPEALAAGTLNTHGLAGLMAACDYLQKYGQARMLVEATELANSFAEGVKALLELFYMVILKVQSECLWLSSTYVTLILEKCQTNFSSGLALQQERAPIVLQEFQLFWYSGSGYGAF